MTKSLNLNTVVQNLPDTLKQEVNTENGSLYVNSKYILITNTSLVLKSKLYGRDGNSINSVISVWKGADLQEREIWDLMGIFFEGHPNMKRILLWEGFKGHPLRKDFLK